MPLSSNPFPAIHISIHIYTNTNRVNNHIQMSSLIRISPPMKGIEVVSRSLHSQSDLTRFFLFHCNSKMGSVIPNYLAYSTKFHRIGGGNVRALTNYEEKRPVQGALDSTPVSVELEPISSESQFDRVIAEAQQLEESVVILWMARWCRKCIYLKPKLEKLAADYYPRIRFYCIDVNNVPHKLVVRAGITKMPTIQLWKDSKKLAEVIGGHKAYLVVNEVCDMIESEVMM